MPAGVVSIERAMAGRVAPMNSGVGGYALLPGPIRWTPPLKKFYVGVPGSTYSGGSELGEVDPALVSYSSNTNIGEYQ